MYKEEIDNKYKWDLSTIYSSNDEYEKDFNQVKENIGTVMQPELVWFGSYYKYDVVNRN